GGLVAEDPVRLVERGPDQGDLLRHAARIGGEHRVRAVGEVEPLEQPSDALAPRGDWDAVQKTEVIEVFGRRVAPVKARLVGHHAKSRANGVQALGDAKAVELDQAFIGAEDASQAAQGGGLAGAVLAEKDEDLAALDM